MSRVCRCVMLASSILLAAPFAASQCLPALCALSISLQSDASGVTLGGSGTNAASLSFGSMQAFGGSTPTGVTKNVGGTNWTISTPFDVKVICYNIITLIPCTLLISPTYTLTAQLQSTDATNTWKIAGSTLSSASAITLTTGGVYATTNAYTLALTIPFTESAGTISNTINFVAVSN